MGNIASNTQTITLNNPAIVYVDATATGDNTGCDWANALLNVQDAVNIVAENGEILIAAGTYSQNSKIIIAKQITLKGGFPSGGDIQDIANNLTVLDGNNSDRVLEHSGAGELTIQGLTIQNGRVNAGGFIARGGGIFSITGNLTLDQVVLQNNEAISASVARGGGLFSESTTATVTIINSNINNNAAEVTNSWAQGGGIYVTNILNIEYSVVQANEAEGNTIAQGGGIYAKHINSVGCQIIANTSTSINASAAATLAEGGAIYISEDGSLDLTNTKIQGNSALHSRNNAQNATTRGGGVFISANSTAHFMNTEISANRATHGTTLANISVGGGGISVINSPITLTNSLLFNNSIRRPLPSDGGGGIGGGIGGGTVVFQNSILWNNTREDSSGTGNVFADEHSNTTSFIANHSLIKNEDLSDTNGINATIAGFNPLFEDEAGGDFRLQSSSPLIDAGLDSFNTTTEDLDGNPRFIGPIDIGPYEFAMAAPQEVNLSVSTNSRTEDTTTAIAVTATTSNPVTGDQTVDLILSGTATNNVDYTLTPTSITILDGQTTGTANFTVIDDTDIEGDETATITLDNPSAGISLGTIINQDITIIDDDFIMAVCQDITVQLDTNGNASILGTDVDGGSTASLGVASLSVSPNSFSCADVGTPVTVTLTVTDNGGNTASCTATVTIEDNMAPTAVCLGGGSSSGFGDTNPFTFIPDNNPAGITSTLNITDNLSITNLNVYLSMTHTWVGDISVSLQSPAGTIAVIYDRPGVPASTLGCAGDDIEATMADEAFIFVEDVCNDNNSVIPSIFGTFRPNSPLSVFDGESTLGTWTLTVTDNASLDIGTLDGWGLTYFGASASLDVFLDANGSAAITAADINNGSNDACGIALLSISPNTFDCSNVGLNTVTLTVTDDNGNISTCTSLINVVDNITPTAICQDITVQLDAAGNASIAGTDIDNGSNDACGIASLAVSPNTFDCGNIGENTVTLTVTDNSGNVSTCTANVTVEDNVAPVPMCVADFTIQLDANGDASITTVDIDDSSTDACGIASTSIDVTDFTCADVGPNTVTLTVTDNNGNTAMCTTVVTVEDNIPPVVTCPADVTTECNIISPADTGMATATDNCDANPVVTFSDSVVAGVGNNSVITRTWTATDANGNASSCDQIITAEDRIPPVVTCPADITIECDASTAPSNTGMATAIDNCDANPTVTFSDVVVAGVGNNSTITRTWTATDANGNVSSCDQIITVEDSTPPVITCPADITIECDESTDPSNTGMATATDNCDATPVITFSDSVVAGVGNNSVITRTWTATDANGNASSCGQIITVEDSTPPVITCPADVTVECDASTDPSNTGMATATDNCDANPTITFSDSVTAGVGNNSVITRTWTATDANGNASSCDQVITVEDSTPPVITCPADVTVECDAPTSPADTGMATATDNCDANPVIIFSDSVTAGVGNNSVITRTWTATDANGNASSCDQVITVEDSIAPVITCPADVTTECDAIDPADTGMATATDNCDANPVITFSDSVTAGVGNNSVITRTWTATDANGNASSCDQVITAEDTTPPVITCPADITVECNDFDDPSDTGIATATDNCDAAPVVTFTNSPLVVVGDTRVFTRTWTATDANGNASSCDQVITIEDTTPPTIVCPADIVVDNDPGICGAANVDLGTPTADDSCNVTGVGNDAPAVFPVGDTTVTWTVTDLGGNTATCTQLVTVVDTEAPVLTCPTEDVVVAADSSGGEYTVEDFVVNGTVTVTDNCDDPVAIISQEPVVGTTLLEGQTTVVTVTVEDSAGNTAECSFGLFVDPSLGVGDIDLSVLTLYPNPASGTVTLRNQQGIELDNVSIFDIRGRLVQRVDLTGMGVEKTLDIAILENATYMVVISSQGNITTKQLIVNNY